MMQNMDSEYLINGVYIYGTGELGRFAVHEFEKNNIVINGVLGGETKSFCGIEVVELKDVPVYALIVLCSWSYPIIRERLEYEGYLNTVYFEAIPYFFNGIHNYYTLYTGELNYYDKYEAEISKVQKLLADDISKMIYKDLISYRKTLDDKYCDNAYLKSVERGTQYFDTELIKFTQDEIFWDCGGYYGETSEEFIFKTHNSYREIVIFEPNTDAYTQLQNNLKKYNNVKCIRAGVGEKRRVSHLIEVKGGASVVSEDAETEIEIVSLDGMLDANLAPTYVKMDIEGSEVKAIEGATKIISKYKPKLAISVYHKPNDIFEIPLLINNINSEYKFYVRHYTRLYGDTILYCI